MHLGFYFVWEIFFACSMCICGNQNVLPRLKKFQLRADAYSGQNNYDWHQNNWVMPKSMLFVLVSIRKQRLSFDFKQNYAVLFHLTPREHSHIVSSADHENYQEKLTYVSSVLADVVNCTKSNGMLKITYNVIEKACKMSRLHVSQGDCV